MNAIRFLLLRSHIALLLRQSEPLLYPEERLASDLKLITSPEPTRSEFEEVVARMEKARHILRSRTEDEGVKMKLSELGEAELPR